jgi:hypothetical protein
MPQKLRREEKWRGLGVRGAFSLDFRGKIWHYQTTARVGAVRFTNSKPHFGA